MPQSERPLSPHLQIYKPQLTSLLSILHRLTGIYLSFFLFGFVYWLYLLSFHEKGFVCAMSFLQSIWGKFFVLGSLFSFFYHLCNGLRHLVWDVGKGLDLPSVYQGGYLVLLLTVILTFITCLSVWWV